MFRKIQKFFTAAKEVNYGNLLFNPAIYQHKQLCVQNDCRHVCHSVASALYHKKKTAQQHFLSKAIHAYCYTLLAIHVLSLRECARLSKEFNHKKVIMFSSHTQIKMKQMSTSISGTCVVNVHK